MHYIYLIENPEGKIYIGATNDPSRRCDEHNDDTREKGWTKGKGPWTLIYTESLENVTEALKRERFLKSLKAGKRIKQILKIER